MQLDKRAIDRLLSLNDEQLKSIINGLAQSSGLDLSSFNITPGDISSIRHALSTADNEDLKRASEQLNNYKKSRG